MILIFNLLLKLSVVSVVLNFNASEIYLTPSALIIFSPILLEKY